MTRLVFASCMSALADAKQPVWTEAAAHRPNWLILCGDNIYMDYFPNLNQSRAWSLSKFADEMQMRYARQFAISTFRSLVTSIPEGHVIGVWDDHDFAWNNCFGADPADDMADKKKVATALHHHYFSELNRRPLAPALPPLAMPDLKNPPSGGVEVYRALDIQPFRVLLCDGRSYRGEHATGTTSGPLLGRGQEEWLFNELRAPGPFLLVTGSTMTAGGDQSWDYYQDFYKGRFLPAVQGKLVLFMAGDVHENRLPPRVADHPIEAVSSAAVLDFPFNRRNFGVVDILDTEVQLFLYSRGRVQYTGVLDLGSGSFASTMAVLADEVAAPTSEKLADEQRAAGLWKLQSLK